MRNITQVSIHRDDHGNLVVTARVNPDSGTSPKREVTGFYFPGMNFAEVRIYEELHLPASGLDGVSTGETFQGGTFEIQGDDFVDMIDGLIPYLIDKLASTKLTSLDTTSAG